MLPFPLSPPLIPSANNRKLHRCTDTGTICTCTYFQTNTLCVSVLASSPGSPLHAMLIRDLYPKPQGSKVTRKILSSRGPGNNAMSVDGEQFCTSTLPLPTTSIPPPIFLDTCMCTQTYGIRSIQLVLNYFIPTCTYVHTYTYMYMYLIEVSIGLDQHLNNIIMATSCGNVNWSLASLLMGRGENCRVGK